MKKLLYLSLLLIFWACDEDKSVDPTIMPPATTTGENTIGCLVDGWIYASGRFGKPKVNAYEEKGNHYVKIQSEVGLFTILSLTLVDPGEGATCTYTNATFDGGVIEDGKAYITRLDGQVISGTFAGGEISEGRFDVKYKENENSY